METKPEDLKEKLEGYLVDIVCLRTIPLEQMSTAAKEHTTACALMGHCVESGYGLVRKDGNVALLDSKATPHVVQALMQASTEMGA